MKLRWLHISDLHFSRGVTSEPGWVQADFNESLVARSLVNQIPPLVAEKGLVDFIIITGDIAFHAHPEEYEIAQPFISSLLAATKVPQSRLYLVPGNHDVDRSQIRRSHLRTLYRFDTQDDISEILSDPVLFSLLMAKFRPFNDFAHQAMGRRHFDERTFHMVEALELQKKGRLFHVSLVGLNTCLFAGYNGDDRNKLAFGLRQVELALEQCSRDAAITIGYFHHPFECLHPSDGVCQNRLLNQLDIILTGHIHKPNNVYIKSNAGEALMVGAGAAYQGRTSVNHVNLFEVDLATGHGEVTHFKYLPEYHVWKQDTDISPHAPGGVFRFSIERLQHSPILPAESYENTNDDKLVDRDLPSPSYDIFISYHRSDADCVKERIIPILTQHESTDGGQLRIFHDVKTLEGGDAWNRAIARAIQNCKHFVPVYSDAFFASDICQWELSLAWSRDPQNKQKLIVPIAARGFKTVPFEYKLIHYLAETRKDLTTRLATALNLRPLSKGVLSPEVLSIELDDLDLDLEITPHSEVHFVHDYLLPEEFTGRTEERARLRAILDGRPDPVTGKKAEVTTVRAIGGMGKSCLIRKVVEETRGDCRFDHIVWYSFYEAREGEARDFFVEVLGKLGEHPIVETHEVPGRTEVKLLCRQLRRLTDQHRVLIVIDGLEVAQHTLDSSSSHYGRLKSTHEEIGHLITHVCNQSKSAALVTTRVPLRAYDGLAGHLEICLDVMSPAAGAQLLVRLGVEGSQTDREDCSRVLGGHPLCLRAAGKLLVRRQLRANQIDEIVGDIDMFTRTSEGEKIGRIAEQYRVDLDPRQEYFLRMLSIHPRSVGEESFSVLVKDYHVSSMSAEMIWRDIVAPLEDSGLIDVVRVPNSGPSFFVHPLMKFAFSAWFDDMAIKRAHQQWANAAVQDPRVVSSARDATSVAQLEPYLVAIEHHLAADNYQLAWDLLWGKKVGHALTYLGEVILLSSTAQKLLNASNGLWSCSAKDISGLHELIARSEDALGNGLSASASYTESLKAISETQRIGHIFAATRVLASSLAANGYVRRASSLLHKAKSPYFERDIVLKATVEQHIQLSAGNYTCRAISQIPPDDAARSPLNYALGLCWYAEAKARRGCLAEADVILGTVEEICDAHTLHGVVCDELLPLKIYQAIKSRCIQDAREHENARSALAARLGRRYVQDPFLLIGENRLGDSLRVCIQELRPDREPPLAPAKRIFYTLARGMAFWGLGDSELARRDVNGAQSEMDDTGCYRERDRHSFARDSLRCVM